jgi:hypothetical protein
MAPVHKFADGEEVEIKNKNRFSVFLPKGHTEMGDLEKWRGWFLSRGINACLMEVPGKGFAVYRNGLIQIRESPAQVSTAKAKSNAKSKAKSKEKIPEAPKRRGRPKKQPVVNR